MSLPRAGSMLSDDGARVEAVSSSCSAAVLLGSLLGSRLAGRCCCGGGDIRSSMPIWTRTDPLPSDRGGLAVAGVATCTRVGVRIHCSGLEVTEALGDGAPVSGAAGGGLGVAGMISFRTGLHSGALALSVLLDRVTGGPSAAGSPEKAGPLMRPAFSCFPRNVSPPGPRARPRLTERERHRVRRGRRRGWDLLRDRSMPGTRQWRPPPRRGAPGSKSAVPVEW